MNHGQMKTYQVQTLMRVTHMSFDTWYAGIFSSKSVSTAFFEMYDQKKKIWREDIHG